MTVTDIRRHLFRTLLDTLVVPALAGSEDLDIAVGAIKKGVVEYLNLQGMPKDATAKHCSKSDRWVYRCLQGGGDDTKEGLGYQIMVAVVNHLQSVYPTPASLQNCTAAVQHLDSISEKDMEDLLKLYSKLGYVKKIQGSDGPGYAAVEQFMELNEQDAPLHLTRLYDRLALIWPLAQAYADRKEGAEFGKFQGSITRKQYRILQNRIRKATRESVAEAIINSMEEDPDEMDRVSYHGLFALGMDILRPNGDRQS